MKAFAQVRRVPGWYFDQFRRGQAVPRFAPGIGDIEYKASASPDERTVIHLGRMMSGYARNIVSDYSHLLGTIRAYDDESFAELVELITGKLAEMEELFGCSTNFTRSEGYPPVINDKGLYEVVLPLASALEGGYEQMADPLMISEDFSFYGHYAPAVFFLLGTGTGISLHSTDFDFNESILVRGFELYKSLLLHTDFTRM